MYSTEMSARCLWSWQKSCPPELFRNYLKTVWLHFALCVLVHTWRWKHYDDSKRRAAIWQ